MISIIHVDLKRYNSSMKFLVVKWFQKDWTNLAIRQVPGLYLLPSPNVFCWWPECFSTGAGLLCLRFLPGPQMSKQQIRWDKLSMACWRNWIVQFLRSIYHIMGSFSWFSLQCNLFVNKAKAFTEVHPPTAMNSAPVKLVIWQMPACHAIALKECNFMLFCCQP